LNANRGHINTVISTGAGALSGALAGYVTAGTTATTIASVVGVSVSIILTEGTPTLHPGDILIAKYKICKSDTDFGVQVQDSEVTIISSN